MKKVFFILGIFFFHSTAYSVSNEFLPKEVCLTVGATKDILKQYKMECREKDLRAVYADLNSDGTNELIVSFLGGSCGDQYYVFQLNEKLIWKEIGGWCGCEEEIPLVKKTKHNGYSDIYTCGVSGFFNGKKYIGKRQ
jgi:hypothetical protein